MRTSNYTFNNCSFLSFLSLSFLSYIYIYIYIYIILLCYITLYYYHNNYYVHRAETSPPTVWIYRKRVESLIIKKL